MRLLKPAVLVLPAVLLGVAAWVTYRMGWFPPSPPPSPSAEYAGPPVVEFREVQSGPGGETGSVLTIDRTGQATVQTLPLGPGSKTSRTQLTCDELAWLPQAMKDEFA